MSYRRRGLPSAQWVVNVSLDAYAGKNTKLRFAFTLHVNDKASYVGGTSMTVKLFKTK